MDKIPVLVMFENKKHWTINCLKYLYKNTDPEIYRLVLINNGSFENEKNSIVNSIDYEYDILDLETKVGVPYAYNAAIEKFCSDSDYFVILHNDCFVSQQWLNNLLEYTKEDSFWCAFPRTNYSTEETACLQDQNKKDIFEKFKRSNKSFSNEDDIFEVLGKTYPEGFDEFSEGISQEPYSFKYVEELCNFCILFNKKVFDETGGFDEDFLSSSAQYKILNYRAMKRGFYPFFALNVYTHHNGNTTSDSIGRNFVIEKEKEENLLYSKIKKYEDLDYKLKKINTKAVCGEVSFLFIRNDGIGDIIMSMFTLAGIKSKFPNVKITYATDEGFLGFVSNFECVDNVIPFKSTLNRKICESDLEDISKIYEEKFDYVFNLVKFFEITNKNNNDHRITQVLDFVKKSGLEFLEGIEIEVPQYRDINKYKCDNLREDIPVIAISPIGTCEIRSMKREVWEKILELESKDKQVLILGKDKIYVLSENINSENIINLSGKTNLEDLPTLISKCEYIYTPDSGTFHIAGILAIPCRAFFGSIDPDKRDGFYPSSDKNKIYFNRSLKCAPCWDVGCAEVKCMKYSEKDIERIVDGEPVDYE